MVVPQLAEPTPLRFDSLRIELVSPIHLMEGHEGEVPTVLAVSSPNDSP